MTQTKYIDLMTTKKLVADTLKVEFPGIAFRLTTKRGSTTTSLRIQWTDGPTWESVQAVTQWYSGAHFDAMTDLLSPRDHTNEAGETVQYGADYIICERAYSEAFLAAVVAYAEPRYAWTDEPRFEVLPPTRWSGASIRANNTLARFGSDWAADFVMRLCRDTSAEQAAALR